MLLQINFTPSTMVGMKIDNAEIFVDSNDAQQDVSLLQEIFADYNTRCFNDKLSSGIKLRWAEEIKDSRTGKTAVGVSSTGFYEGLGDLDAPYIFIDRKLEFCRPVLELSLLHEMCHHRIASGIMLAFDGHNELFLKTLLEALYKLDWYPLLGQQLPNFNVMHKPEPSV